MISTPTSGFFLSQCVLTLSGAMSGRVMHNGLQKSRDERVRLRSC
jgi:hypothetical protein